MAKTFLVCEASAFIRMMVSDILTKNGWHSAGEAADGKTAVEKYKELSPDLVVMGAAMPEMDGVTALKEILRADAGAKVVMLFPKDQQAEAGAAVRAGAKGCVWKPFRPEELISALRKLSG